MTDPTSLRRLAPGKRHDPSSVDAVPSDWATVQYTVVIAAHPDNPALPILKFIPVASSLDASPVYVDDGVGGFEAIYDNDGIPIYGSD